MDSKKKAVKKKAVKKKTQKQIIQERLGFLPGKADKYKDLLDKY